MELVWEDPPVPTGPFFTRDGYDKYSIAPSVRDLWASLQSPGENTELKQDIIPSPSTKPEESKDNFHHSEEDAGSDIQASDEAEDCAETKTPVVAVQNGADAEDVSLPEPRVPFPCLSGLSVKEQKMYLGFLKSKKTMMPHQNLMARVNMEVTEFQRYLQMVSKMCADDYSFIPPAAAQYSEDFFRSCLEHVRALPQRYKIHEMTSLTGGKFNPGLTLTFEKQLLIMGNVDITDHKIVAADAQLALDYPSVSSAIPPAKRAEDKHATISSDNNAEKLCARYEPHVCLTRDALVRLLNNHGPDFADQWELPVWVKSNSGKGSAQRQTVFVDSPLLKTQTTVRERSHVYHEESLKLAITRTGSKHIFHLMTEVPASEQAPPPESSQRSLVTFDNDDLDFEADLTDLETFGETTVKRPSKKVVDSPSTQRTKTNLVKKTQKETANPAMDGDGPGSLPVTSRSPAEMETINQDSDHGDVPSADSEDDRLIIDHLATPSNPKAAQAEASPLTPSPASSQSPSSPQRAKAVRRRSKKLLESGDQLGEILRMQTAMLNPTKDAPRQPPLQDTPSHHGTAPSAHSLVKPCVSSYLESSQRPDREADADLHHGPPPPPSLRSPERRKILSEELQASAEDEQDYDTPQQGNLIYKLYSLQELLLMVRSSIPLTHTRRTDSSPNKFVPVHILPKLEYQLCYGVECVTCSEACQLWTETALHPSTMSYVAHINAHTSRVALLRKLPDDWMNSLSCGFMPSRSLNILHHVLKKLTSLEPGRYLIGHKPGEPFVTILKATDGTGSSGSYNLQQIHSCTPQTPTSGAVPWIPVDPAVVLPFHSKHGRVPCTFPPKPFAKTPKDGWQQNRQKRGTGGQQANANTAGNAKKKRKHVAKRTEKRSKHMQKTIRKSVQDFN